MKHRALIVHSPDATSYCFDYEEETFAQAHARGRGIVQALATAGACDENAFTLNVKTARNVVYCIDVDGDVGSGANQDEAYDDYKGVCCSDAFNRDECRFATFEIW
jgi:hypothetical protein